MVYVEMVNLDFNHCFLLTELSTVSTLSGISGTKLAPSRPITAMNFLFIFFLSLLFLKKIFKW